MKGRVLITGGAGFIGRRVAQAAIEAGWDVRLLDSLVEQVHRDTRPVLPPDVELMIGDVRDPEAVGQALRGVDRIIHLAAEVGVGQSMYQVDRYVAVNDLGTAVLFQQLIDNPVERVVVASSMSIYGEGLYRNAAGAIVEDAARLAAASRSGWDPVDSDGRPLTPCPTPEEKRPSLASVYALTKYVQERLTLTMAPTYGMEGVALRLFNVFGPGQALSNPYTGVLAIFASRLLNQQRPLVFEDGLQRRDFVHVDDVAAAFLLALEHPEAAGGTFNIGSGRDVTVAEIAALVARAMGSDLEPEITGKTRAGDIRHCFADIARARDLLGFQPRRSLEDGLPELAEWVASQQAEDFVPRARHELEARGLVA